MRIVISALLLLAPLGAVQAKTIDVAAGENAQQRLQEALILAAPGDTVAIGPGRFVLTDGLSLDVNGVIIRGAGMAATILDFAGQKGAGEGLLVTSDNVTMRDFAVVDTKGDGIKSKGADNVVYYRVRVAWSGGPKSTNGAYGIYPVESTGVLIDGCEVEGASDAGIYVGQSRDITIRYSMAQGNVAGIEIENSRNALVAYNLATRNTGGILVFDLPSLPVMGGGNTLVQHNLVIGNDTPNFAPKGNIVASVPRGTGIMVMANDGVGVSDNIVRSNPTSGVLVVAYPRTFNDPKYNPYPRNVTVVRNVFSGNGGDSDFPGGAQLKTALGGALPPVIWDGLGQADTLMVEPGVPSLSLGLASQGVGLDQAKPAPFKAEKPVKLVDPATVGAPAALDARIAG